MDANQKIMGLTMIGIVALVAGYVSFIGF